MTHIEGNWQFGFRVWFRLQFPFIGPWTWTSFSILGLLEKQQTSSGWEGFLGTICHIGWITMFTLRWQDGGWGIHSYTEAWQNNPWKEAILPHGWPENTSQPEYCYGIWAWTASLPGPELGRGHRWSSKVCCWAPGRRTCLRNGASQVLAARGGAGMGNSNAQRKHILNALTQKANTHNHGLPGPKRGQWTPD